MPERALAGNRAAWPQPRGLDGLTRWAEVDCAALTANARAVRAYVGGDVALMAMVKANGYGHGAVLAAQAFVDGGATWLGVAGADEALQLRAAGIGTNVLVTGWTPPAMLDDVAAARIDVTVVDAVSATAVAACARPIRVHIKVDTGMSRLGIAPADVPEIAAVLGSARNVTVAGVFTHFAHADGDAAATARQAEIFAPVVSFVRERFGDAIVHACNSAALVTMPGSRAGMVRAGIGLYGYPPVAAPELQLTPAMTMCTRVTQVRTLRAGDTVGYGREWTAPAGGARLATLAAGYADGIHRTQGNRGAVLINGRRCPIRGRVSMDQISVDIGDAGAVSPGDVAVVFGRDAIGTTLGADVVGAAGGTISYEVLTSVSARVPRVVTG